MSAEQIGRLFKPFVQADRTTSRDYGGADLGLSITKTLAHLLGGDLSVTSAPGAGTTFELTIKDKLARSEGPPVRAAGIDAI